MATKNLQYKIFGTDKSASKAMDSVAARAGKAARAVGKAAAGIALAIGVVLAKFAVDSVKAAADAETQQAKLAAAWAKFPAVVDVSIDSLRDYNSELAKTTKYDDDAIASGQVVLARFKLTGAQIKKVTPLLLDYASATGKDLPTAAESLGKALLGNAKALKTIGIQFKPTGDQAKDFQTIMGLVSDKVGGFAENEGKTAAGKLEILKNRFGEVQESIGNALMPTLDDLLKFTNDTVLPGLENFSDWFTKVGMPAVRDFLGWVDKYKDILGPAAVAIGVLTAAQWLLNIAMAANPVGLVIIGIAALIAYLAVLATDFGGFRTKLVGWNMQIVGFFLDINAGIATVIEGGVNGIIDMLNTLLKPINAIRSFFGLGPLGAIGHVDWASFAQNAANAVGIANSGGVQSGGSSGSGGNRTQIHSFASGGIVKARPGGILAQIGEGGSDEAIIPLNRAGGLGMTVQVIVPGGFVGDEDKLSQKILRTLKNSSARGAIPSGALGF